jgi:hypothetical protein
MRFKTLLPFICFIILGLWSGYSYPAPQVLAQSSDQAEVEFFIQPPAGSDPKQAFTVGDQITLRLEIRHPASSRVVLPQVEEQWETFTVVDQTAPQTVDNGDGTATTAKDIVVSLFQPGQYQTPPIIVTHRQPDGSIEELATPVIPITVVSILQEGDTELRDLKPQVALPEPVLWPWLLGAILAFILLSGLLAALLFWLYYRRQHRPVLQPVPVTVVDHRPPEVIAYAELNRIEAMQLPAKNQIKEYYALVSACLRRYIEGRYHISALEQTTAELRQAFRTAKTPAHETHDLMNVVTESDYVKFARYRPRDTEINNLINQARAVVDKTTVAAKAKERPPLPPPKQETPGPTLTPVDKEEIKV